jgi:serine/threonine protein kinase
VCLARACGRLTDLQDEHFNSKVADFGIARLKQAGAVHSICGSPAWMAPEVLRGAAFSEASDAYSFGVLLWEMVRRLLLPHSQCR